VSIKWRLLCGLLLVSLCSLGSECQTRIPVWIDTDPSVERGGHEIDDGFALLQAFHSPELEIQGVSIVFGNAPLLKTWPIGTEIVSKFGPKGLGVYRGAAGSDELGKETDASKALARSLQRGPLNILAIGPVTNVATVLKLHPELGKNVVQIIAVAGRRPGQQFLSSPNQAHGFRDLNFELDPAAFQVLLDANVPIVLAPWEISSKVWITRADLERLDQGGRDARYLVPPAMDWLNWWHDNLGAEGFNPFDTLAVGYLTSPALYQCTKSKIRINVGPDDTGLETAPRTKPFLIVSPNQASSHTVIYCSTVNSRFKEDLLGRLMSH
jgi:inosine-uridine nucleoside N-ribohydrolase